MCHKRGVDSRTSDTFGAKGQRIKKNSMGEAVALGVVGRVDLMDDLQVGKVVQVDLVVDCHSDPVAREPDAYDIKTSENRSSSGVIAKTHDALWRAKHRVRAYS